MTVFLTAAVRAELHAAQVQLDRHTGSSADGRCLECGGGDPCERRRAALRVFGRYGRLPRRWPGGSLPGRVTVPQSWSGWLGRAVGEPGSSG